MSKIDFQLTCEAIRSHVREVRQHARQVQYCGHLIGSPTPETRKHRVELESAGWQIQAEGLKVQTMSWELESDLWEFQHYLSSRRDKKDGSHCLDQAGFVQIRKIKAHVTELGNLGREIEFHNRNFENIAPQTQCHGISVEAHGRDIQIYARHMLTLAHELYGVNESPSVRDSRAALHAIAIRSLTL